MPATPERSLESIANSLKALVHIAETLNRNFVDWAKLNNATVVEHDDPIKKEGE